jgi:NAD(P)-dependent dehydrogenase (short-subunit alcohol dehydrogenase family)
MQRTILITGATGNLGKEVVNTLHAEGHTLLTTYHSTQPDEAFKQKVTHLESLDLDEESASSNFLHKLTDRFPKLDAAVLLAGGYAPGSIDQTDESLINQQLDLNFRTAWNMAKPVMDHFKKRGGGQFIFMGSRPAISPEAGKSSVAYALSKSLLFSLADIINADGKAMGITASVIVPSILDTPQNRKDMPDADFSKWVRTQDVAKTISFILSEQGQLLRQPVFKIYNRS